MPIRRMCLWINCRECWIIFCMKASEKFVTPESELDFTSNLIEINKIKVNPLFDFRIKSQIDKQDPVYKRKF